MTNQTEYSTGLRIVWDDRSRDYPVRTLFGAGGVPASRRWPCYSRLDQDGIGACVGFAIANELAADPVSIKGVTNALGFEIYRRAQLIDEWPGEEPTVSGTSMLAGLKIGRDMGFYKEFRWAFGLDDVMLTLSELGPVCYALPWYDSMFQPQPDGRLVINGIAKGGHAILGDELDLEKGDAWILNQWAGPNWGIDGRAKIALEDLDKLLRQGGQAGIPLMRLDPNGPPPIPPPPPEPAPGESLNDRILREMGPIHHVDMDIVFTNGQHWPWRGNAP